MAGLPALSALRALGPGGAPTPHCVAEHAPEPSGLAPALPYRLSFLTCAPPSLPSLLPPSPPFPAQNNLSKILKCAANDDKITMKADDDGDVVSWIFEGEASERVSDFELKLMEIDTEHLGIPETEYTCKVKLPSGEFQRIIRDISTLGDTCTIAVAKDSVKFSVKGDIGTGHITRKHVPEKGGDGDKKGAEADYTVIEMDVPCEQTFAIRYLGFFIKATSLSSSVTLHLSADVPLLVEYKVDEIGTMRFYLAPKIEDESA